MQLKEGGTRQLATAHALGAEALAAMPPVTLATAPLEDPHPRCTQLIKAYQSMPNAQNKTPLAVLHEYAVRFNLEVWAPDSCSCLWDMLALFGSLSTARVCVWQILYMESAESSLGPFTVEAKLCSSNGSVTTDVATGQASNLLCWGSSEHSQAVQSMWLTTGFLVCRLQ